MAFDGLSSRLQMALRRVTGRGKLNENDIDEMLKEVRISLLEADVNFKVVREFLKDVKEKAVGEKIMKGLNPGQEVVKIVREELKATLGDETSEIVFAQGKPTVIMTCGLQGAGKTTACAKMAVYYRKKMNKKPFLIAADIYRPAAVDQLVTLGKQASIPVFEMGTNVKPEKIVEEGLKEARKGDYDLIIIDTAGRLHIDEALMAELQRVEKIAKPNEVLLTVDAMTGQDAVNIAKSFNEQLKLTGCILTKMDGDTRGGAALSIKKITGIPIKLMSTGEKLDAIEVFHPDRLADRILGMGDVLSLIDTVSENVDEDEMMDMTEKLMSGKYNYNDLLKQFKMIQRMGSISKILGFLPGLKQVKQAMSQVDDSNAFKTMECIISSMTDEERKNPQLINTSASRRERIAKGSGRSVAEVNRLREALDTQIKTMKKMQNMSEDDMKKMSTNLQNGNFSNVGSAKVHKGKGKGKGNFRF